MGNCVQERKPLQTLFDQQELKKLNQVFDDQCDLLEETRRNRQLSQQSFEEIFIENPEFGRKMFKFLEIYGQKEKYIQRDTLFYILEVLIKDGSSVQSLRNLTRIEIFALISLKSSQYIKNKEELHQFKITYLDAFTIINDILRIRLSGDNFQNIDERATRAILDSIYKVENGTIEWFELIKQLKMRLNGLSILIKQYFKNKFLHTKIQQLLPTLSQNSYLLNEDTLFLLSLSSHNSKLKGSIKLELLYSNLVHHGGFKQLVNNVLSSEMPTLILCQHEEKYQNLNDESKLIKTNIIGAISNQRWFDTGLPQGDEKDCIFSIYPQLVVFHPKKDRKASKNYCYFNSKDITKPQGIGFGYNDNKFRIWIDKDLKNCSCSSEDQTFETGDLVHKHIKKLQISIIEIWGIVQPNIEEQHEEQKIANAEPEIEKIEFEYNEEPPVQVVESNSNYYWSKKEEEKKIETYGSNSFYWNNSKTNYTTNQNGYSSLTKSVPASIIQQPQDQQYYNDILIAQKLVGGQPQNTDQFTQNIKQTSTISRRSNLQRPVLDFIQKPQQQQQSIPTTEPIQFTQQQQPKVDLNSDVDRKSQQNVVFGTKIEETKYPDTFSNQYIQNNRAISQSSNSLGASSRGRKTADQIIQDYELRKSKKQ